MVKGSVSADLARQQAVRNILRELDRLDPARARYLAALAFVLSRVADADHVICEAEVRRIETILGEEGRLPSEQAMLVAEIAKHRLELADCWVQYRESRDLRPLLDEQRRQRLLRCLYAVAEADGRLAPEEVGEIRQIATELGFADSELSAAHPATA